MKTLLCFVCALLLSLQGVAYGADPENGKYSGEAQAVQTKNTETIKIRITANGQAMIATMANNETARDFVAMLPLTLTMDDLFQREKFATLPRTASHDGPRDFAFRVGQIVYWSPKNDVAIFYRHDGQTIPAPGIIVMGEIESGVEALNVPGQITVTFEIAN